jgi:translation initiation factor IF-3
VITRGSRADTRSGAERLKIKLSGATGFASAPRAGSLRNATTLAHVEACVRAIKWSPGSHPPLTGRSGPVRRRVTFSWQGCWAVGSPLRRTTTSKRGDPITTETRINDRIRVPEVRLVGPNGEQVGIVRIEDALRLAQEAELDLVEVAATARPPVCKLMDYGKFKYESAQKARESRRNQQLTVIKEQKLRPKIDTHDYETKKRNVVRFLEGGNKVKVTIMFRGREQSRPELGFRLLQRLAEDVAELGTVEAAPKQDGRNMTMVIAPNKKPAKPRPVAQAADATQV